MTYISQRPFFALFILPMITIYYDSSLFRAFEDGSERCCGAVFLSAVGRSFDSD